MYFGDYHTHTVYSHGKGTIEDNVLAARRLGLKQIAVTDHGFGHAAYAVKPAKLAEMRREVERRNAKYPDIRVLLGLECNLISASGDMDLRDGEEKLTDVVICGFHKFAWAASLRQTFAFMLPNIAYSMTGHASRKDVVRNTDAYIKMLEKHKADILSHLNYAIKADAVEVALACKHFGTLVELNGKRVNLTDEEIEKMLENDVDFIVDSDAHSPSKVGDFSEPDS